MPHHNTWRCHGSGQPKVCPSRRVPARRKPRQLDRAGVRGDGRRDSKQGHLLSDTGWLIDTNSLQCLVKVFKSVSVVEGPR